MIYHTLGLVSVLLTLLLKLKIPFVLSVYFALFFFFISLSGVLFIFQVETVPSELLPIVATMQFGATVIIGFFTLPAIRTFGIFGTFLGCTIISFITWLVVEGYCIETKDKSKIQIMQEFNAKRFFQD
jgi:hypothetical protein